MSANNTPFEQLRLAALQTLIDNSSAIIFSVDKYYAYLAFNRLHADVMKSIYGVTIRVGDNLLEMMTVMADRETAKANIDRALAGETVVESAFSGDGALSREYFQVRHIPIFDEHHAVVGVNIFSENVSELMRAEIARKSSEELFSISFMHASAANALIQPDGKFLKVNPAFCAMMGYNLDEMETRSVSSNISAEDRDAARGMMDEICAGAAENASMELRWLRKDGETIWTHFSCNAFRDANGVLIYVIAQVLDISAAKRTQDELIEQKARLAELLNERTNQIQSSEAVYSSMFDRMNSVILMLDAGTNRVLAANKGACDFYGYQREELLGLSIQDITLLPTGEVRENTSLITAGVKTHFTTAHRMASGEIRDVDVYVGPVSFQNRLAIIAVIHDITARTRAEKELRDSEQKLQVFIDVIPDLIWSARPDGYVDYFNQGWLSFAGMTQEQAKGNGWITALHPDDVESIIRQWGEATREGSFFDVESRLRRFDGEYRWFLSRARPFLDEKGMIVKWYGVNTDITERKKMETAIRESEERFSTIFHSSPDPINIISLKDRRVVDANAAFCAISGLQREKILNLPMNELRLWKFPVDWEKIIDQVKANGSITDTEAGYVTSAGQTGFMLFSARSINLGGEECILIMGHDVTSRKHLEQELHEKSDFLSQIINAMGQGMTVTNTERRIEMVNPAFAKLLGYSIQELVGKRPKDLTSAEDQTIVEGAREDRLRGEITAIEGHMLRADGSLVPALITSSPRYKNDLYAGTISIYTDLTEVKRNEKLRHASDERFNKAFRSSPIGINIFRLSDGRPVDANLAFQEMVGYSYEELVATSIDKIDLFIERKKITKWFIQFMREGSIHNQETAIRMKTGEVRYLLFSIESFAMQDEPLGLALCVDITDRKRTEQALIESEKRFSAVFHSSPESISISRLSDGVIMDVNDAYCLVFGVSKDDVIGRSGSDLQFWVDMADREKLVSTIREKGMASGFELSIRRASGEIGSAYVSATIINLGGEEVLLLMGFDITPRKKAEAELLAAHAELEQRVLERTRELQATNQALERASRAKDEFLATMSHELRTPLTGILGLSESLQYNTYGEMNEKQLRAVRTIEKSGRHLHELINDVLDLSKMQAGKVELQMAPVDIRSICEASLQMVASMATEKQHDLDFDIVPQNIRLIADERRIKQILVNLLGNAIKFTPAGGRIGLTVLGLEEMGQVRITVADNGIGIAQENLPLLFKPFIQIDSRLSRQFNGTGLGLSLVKNLTEMHGGSVQVESVYGEGSRFSIILPWEK